MRKRAIAWVIGAVVAAAWVATIDAHAEVIGCRGLSPASVEGCSIEELRAALDRSGATSAAPSVLTPAAP